MLFFIFLFYCKIQGVHLISIHPMLFFITGSGIMMQTVWCISIHPMLFFIQRRHKLYLVLEDFNTSNVIFYQCRSSPSGGRKGISIHPMLFFIQKLFGMVPEFSEFQYIQCYFLSTGLRPSLPALQAFQYIQCYFLSRTGTGFSVAWSYFNTSNVIFYLTDRITVCTASVFQYIQCYFLSVIL